MENIKFDYLYRDAGNYKKWGSAIFSNPEKLTRESVTRALRGLFSQECLFIADQIRIPECFLFIEGDITTDDHCFHEFDSIYQTAEPSNDLFSRSASQFIDEVEREAARGWIVFEPLNREIEHLRFHRG